MKQILISIIFILTTSVACCQELAINEFMARNTNVVADQDDEFDDWIEIYNYSSSVISLEGFSLSDDRTELTKWIIPDTSIAAGGFIIVWADNDPEQNGLHAEFKLSGAGEEIILSDSRNNIVDQVSFGEQTANISTGRIPDGTGAFVPMTPTFSALNSPEEPKYKDVTDTLFNAEIIHKYELRFYNDNWQDLLEYNYEVLDQQYMPAQLIYNNSVVRDSIGVRYKGNSSYNRSEATVKKPFKFKFNEYIKDQNLFGVERLNFSNCVNDPSFMREMIGYNIAGRYMPAPRSVYANLYVDDELIGLYILVEQVDDIYLRRHFESNDYNLYKASDDGATLLYLGENQTSYESEYELRTNESDNDWSGFINLISILNNTPDETFAEVISKYLNLDRIISYLAFNMVFSNFDSYTGSGCNFYFYDDRDSGLFNLIPNDYNEAFGVYTNDWNVISQDVIHTTNLDDRPLIRRIMENDSLRSVYLYRIREMIKGPASYDSITAMTERYTAFIEEHVHADKNKLFSDALFYYNIENDVRMSQSQIIPGLKSFSLARNEYILNQIPEVEVFPGDCDNNGVVDALDILPIGVYFLETGSQRDEVSLGWEANPAFPWVTLAATYADANGDGRVDERDVIGIGVNWGNSHDVSSNSFDIDPSNKEKLDKHRDSFAIIYNSFSGGCEAGVEIKALLESILNGETQAPRHYTLEQNFPNPFNPSTIISFSLPESQLVTLSVFDLNGRIVMTPIEKKQYQSGQHEYLMHASILPNGVYIYRLQTKNWSKALKMDIVK